MLERPNSQDHELDLRMCCFQAKIIFYPIPFMYICIQTSTLGGKSTVHCMIKIQPERMSTDFYILQFFHYKRPVSLFEIFFMPGKKFNKQNSNDKYTIHGSYGYC